MEEQTLIEILENLLKDIKDGKIELNSIWIQPDKEYSDPYEKLYVYNISIQTKKIYKDNNYIFIDKKPYK